MERRVQKKAGEDNQTSSWRQQMMKNQVLVVAAEGYFVCTQHMGDSSGLTLGLETPPLTVMDSWRGA
jgi:hypothetical protein